MIEFEIRKLSKTDQIPYNLLYLADPSKEAVSDYLRRGGCYVACINAEIIAVCVLLLGALKKLVRIIF
jgi:hypothetical protein